jgi:hypothetical protein
MARVPTARKFDSSWTPLLVDIDVRSWLSIQEHLGDLLDALIAGWHRAGSGAERDTTEGQANGPRPDEDTSQA